MPLIVFPWEPKQDKGEEQVFLDIAPAVEVYRLAFEKFLREARRPGDDGLSEYERLKANAELFQNMLAEAHTEVTQKYLERREDDYRQQDEILRIKRQFEAEQKKNR